MNPLRPFALVSLADLDAVQGGAYGDDEGFSGYDGGSTSFEPSYAEPQVYDEAAPEVLEYPALPPLPEYAHPIAEVEEYGPPMPEAGSHVFPPHDPSVGHAPEVYGPAMPTPQQFGYLYAQTVAQGGTLAPEQIASLQQWGATSPAQFEAKVSVDATDGIYTVSGGGGVGTQGAFFTTSAGAAASFGSPAFGAQTGVESQENRYFNGDVQHSLLSTSSAWVGPVGIKHEVDLQTGTTMTGPTLGGHLHVGPVGVSVQGSFMVSPSDVTGEQRSFFNQLATSAARNAELQARGAGPDEIRMTADRNGNLVSAAARTFGIPYSR